MLLHMILTGIVFLLIGATGALVATIAKTVAACREFQKKAVGLKILDKFSVWAGHLNSFILNDDQLYLYEALLERFGTKTVGWMYGAQRAVMTADLDLIKSIVVDGQVVDRGELNMPVGEVDEDSIVTANGKQWQRIRRAVAAALGHNKFKTPNVQREIGNSIGKMIRAIDSKLDAAEEGAIMLNIDDYAHRYSLDLVFSCFYKQTDEIDFDAEVEPTTEMFDRAYEAILDYRIFRAAVIFPALKFIVSWLIMHFHPQGQSRQRILDFIKRQTRQNFEAREHLRRLKESGQRVEDEDSFALRDGTRFDRNMIDHMIDQFYEGKLTQAEYFHSAFFLILAGDKTASDCIVHTIYQLAVNQNIQNKLRQSILTDGEESEYLSWVFNESLRMLPPAPVGCLRKISHDYKCQDGVVPADTIVVPATYTIHRLKEYWGADAAEFRPERFADTTNFHPLQFIPFGHGPRGCPGKEFALHEMKRLLCALLTRYKFRCDPIDIKYRSPWLIFMLPDKHVHVQITRIDS